MRLPDLQTLRLGDDVFEIGLAPAMGLGLGIAGMSYHGHMQFGHAGGVDVEVEILKM